MNKDILLSYAIANVEGCVGDMNRRVAQDEGLSYSNIDEYEPGMADLRSQMLELYSRRENACVYPPSDLPDTPEEMMQTLREVYRDDVTKISLVLQHHFPNDYVFYRVSKLEREIFQGFDFFSEIVPEFHFDFDKIRRNAFEDYLILNERLLSFARQYWPDVRNIQFRLELLLYGTLAMMFLETSDYFRYWICNTHHEYWENRHRHAETGGENIINWSVRKEMQKGDLVFLYCAAPVKAITDIYYVHDWPVMDPYGAWDGFRADLVHRCELPNPIPFSAMRTDPVLGDWSVIRRQFQGVVTESVPHSCYDRLLDFIPDDLRQEHELMPEPVSELSTSGTFATEEEYEDTVVAPLLKGWGLSFRRQHPCKCFFGTQQVTGFVDFLVSNQSGEITLFENKLKIVSLDDLRRAVSQGKSYALMLGLPSFVIGSPEGLRLYSLTRAGEVLVRELKPGDDKSSEEQFRDAILNLSRN